jgi:hypothetical protein
MVQGHKWKPGGEKETWGGKGNFSFIISMYDIIPPNLNHTTQGVSIIIIRTLDHTTTY